MRKILFVVPSLSPSGAAQQLRLLAAGLPRDCYEPFTCVLGYEGPFPCPNPDSTPREFLRWTRLFDPQPIWHLRRLVQEFQPEVIHAWDWPAVRAVGLVVAWASKKNGLTPCPRIVVSAPAVAPGRAPRRGWLDRWLLRRADAVVVPRQSEAELFRQYHVPPERIHQVLPGVALPPTIADGALPPESAPALAALRLPRQTRFLGCAGPLELHKGYRNAIWAFDILHMVHDDLHLFLIGGGSDRNRLEQFARAIGMGDRVHFLGYQDDVPGLLARTEAVLVPSLAEGGVNVALEAMAVGRPVVASRVAGLSDIVLDGETGFLVPADDKASLARQARLLVEDGALNRRLGQAGRRRAETHFAAAGLVRGMGQLYEHLLQEAPASKP